jgi:hypothetical protein
MRSVPCISKSALACVVAAFALLVANRAMGQTGGTSGTSGTGGATSLSSSDFTMYLEYYDKGQNDWVQMNTTQQTYFFNRARCECDGDTTDWTGYVKVLIKAASTTSQTIRTALSNNNVSGGFARLYATSSSYNCLSPGSYGFSLQSYCLNLLDPTPTGYSSTGIQGGIAYFENNAKYESPPIPVAWLFGTLSSGVCGSSTSCDSTSTCTNPTNSVIISFWAQTKASTYPDMSDMSISLSTVGKVAYDPPTDVTAEGGNEALIVNWGWASDLSPSTDTNFLGVQLFCQRGESTQVFASGSFDLSYMSATTTCPNIVPLTSSNTGLSQLDPNYLCSGLLPGTTTSHRITGLQNGIPYGVGVAVVDKFYNVSAISTVVYATPIPTVDFYSEYRNVGGKAEGGYCTLSGRRSRPGVVAILGFAGLGLVLRLRRRSKRRRPGAGTLVILVVTGTLTAGQARAQRTSYGSSFEDSFGDSSDDSADAPPPAPADDATDDDVVEVRDDAWTGSPRNFAIEARFGLYTPNIDSEFSGVGTKPQAFMFGSKRRPMWQFEFDWEFLQAFGTLSLGAVVGYYKENAKACIKSNLLATGECVPSGDDTSLRLIPLAALLIYRLDEAAEHWKIPLVPYVKIGLNYTFWTVTNGDGNVSSYSGSGGGRGQGGTMGWQAAVGLSLQLDFLDSGGARTFDTESGVNHTYAFFELDHVDGSGLYRNDALRVGDDTWFAGMMFEF